MFLLQNIFNTIGKLPLIGPHDGFEKDLLLKGKKPVGLFVDITPPSNFVEEKSDRMEKIRNDIETLDKAVDRGLLKKYYFLHCSKSFNFHWNFYCQNHCEKGMYEFIELTKNYLENRHSNGVSSKKDSGEYLGYTAQDINLFHKGGYESLPYPLNYILSQTHDFRKKCRLSSDLGLNYKDLEF